MKYELSEKEIECLMVHLQGYSCSSCIFAFEQKDHDVVFCNQAEKLSDKFADAHTNLYKRISDALSCNK